MQNLRLPKAMHGLTASRSTAPESGRGCEILPLAGQVGVARGPDQSGGYASNHPVGLLGASISILPAGAAHLTALVMIRITLGSLKIA